MGDPSGRKSSRPGLLEQATASGARVTDVIGWMSGHVLRRRAAQLAVVIVAAAVAALVYAFNAPLSREQQFLIAMWAGFTVLGVAGAYLAYRSWDFARRMARHAAAADANLLEMQATLERYQDKFADGDSANSRLERSLAEMRLQHSTLAQSLREQSSSGLASLSSARGDIAELKAKLAEGMSASLDRASKTDAFAQETRDQQNALERALDRTSAQLSVLTSRTDTLSGTVQEAAAQVTSLDKSHRALRQAIGGLEESSVRFAGLLDADRAASSTTADALKSRITQFESDNTLLIGKLEDFRSQLAAVIESDSARTDTSELAERIAALAGSVREFHVREAQRVDEIASRMESLEGAAMSASARTQEDLDLLRRSTGETRASLASVVSAVEQRTGLLESSLAALAQQRQAQARQIGDLEDRIARNTSNQAAAADDFASQLASLRQFAGEESGRLAEVAVVYSELRSKLQTLETSFADRNAAIDVVGERLAGLAETSERTGPLLASLREEFGRGLAEGRAATEGILKDQSEFNASAEERLTRLAGEVASGYRVAVSDGGRIAALEQALSAVETSARSGMDETRKEISALADRTAGMMDKLHAASEQLQMRQEEVAATAHASAKSVMDETRKEISALAERTNGMMEKVHAASEQVRTRHEELAASAQASVKSAMDEIRKEIAALADRTTASLDKLGAASEQLRTQRHELSTAASSISDRVVTLERSISVGASEVDIVKRAVAEMTRAQAASTETSRKTTELLHEQFKSIREAMTGEFGRVGALAAQLDALQSTLEQENLVTRSELQDMKTDLAALSGHIADVVFGIDARVSDISQRLSAAADLAELTDRQLVLDAASWFEPNNRKLRAEHVESLESDWAKLLALDLSRPAIGYMATRVNNLERELDGRLRASLEDTLLRTLVARSIKGTSIRILELGASFGIESAVMFDQLRDHFTQLAFTIVDPLDAFANDTRLDPQTGLPVSERILRRNLSRAGVPDGDIVLIRRPSADLQALEAVATGAYDVLLIDADRSYAGVKVAFENYGRLVNLGGYIVFAGYGDPDHPDVTAFVDEEAAASGQVTRVGESWHTAVYRVVRADGGRRKATIAGAKPGPKPRRRPASRR